MHTCIMEVELEKLELQLEEETKLVKLKHNEEIKTLKLKHNDEIKTIKLRYTNLKKDIKKKYNEKRVPSRKRVSVPKTLKIELWNLKIEKDIGTGKCGVCRRDLDSKNFEAGHIISVKNGGETNLENLLPICSCCNKSMSTENLDDFKKKYFPEQETHKDKYISENLYSINEPHRRCFVSIHDIDVSYKAWCQQNNIELQKDYKEKLLQELISKFGEIKTHPNISFSARQYINNEQHKGFVNLDIKGRNHMGVSFFNRNQSYFRH